MNNHDDAKNYDIIKISYKSNIVGFLLSIILTIIPFWMVMNNSFSHSTVLKIIIICSIIQVIVQLIYFLHLDVKSENGWNIISLVFCAIVILIIVSGSIWIMSNLDYNMIMN